VETFRAPHALNVAVQFKHILISRHAMQAIHVLGDDGKSWDMLFDHSQSLMSAVGARGFDSFTPPGIPVPDQFGVFVEGFRGG